MAYLKNENNEIIVDAILTKYGREKLSKVGKLGVTKFALADDEVDYGLYNTSHPTGEDYYGVAIRELPVLEALPGNDVALKYLLFTNTQANITTVSTLTVAIPDVFSTGVPLKNVSYTINPQINPMPENIDSVYYVAELIDAFGASYELRGLIDPDIGETNQIIQTRKELSKMGLVQEKSVNINSNVESSEDNSSKLPSGLSTKSNSKILGRPAINTSNTVYAVGHSFSFKLLSFPRYQRTFTVNIRSYGPVNSNKYSFNIVIPGIHGSQEELG